MNLRTWLSAALLCVVVSVAQAQAPGQQVEDLMKADGTWEKLGFLDARGREFFDDITAKANAANSGDLRKIAQAVYTQVFTEERQCPALTTAIRRQIELDDLAEVTRWYGTPLGLRLRRLNPLTAISAATPRDLDSAARLFESLSPHRRGLLHDISENSHLWELLLGEQVRTRVVGGAGYVFIQRPSGLPLPQLFEAVIDRFRDNFDRYEQTAKRDSDYHLAQAFETLADAELEEYLRFLRTPAAQAITKAIHDAMGDTTWDAVYEFLRQLNRSGRPNPQAA